MHSASVRFAAPIIMLLCLAAAVRGAAQTVPGTQRTGTNGFATCGRTAPGLGRIVGQFVADAPGVGLRRGAMIKNGCTTVANAQGQFTLVGLPPGDHLVTIAGAAVAPVAPIMVHVAADSTSTVTIHLVPQNRVAECMAVQECADFIAPAAPEAVASLSDTEQVRESAFRIAIMMGYRLVTNWRTTPPPGPSCLAAEAFNLPAAPAVIDAVKRRVPAVFAASECSANGYEAVVIATQARALRFVVSHIVVDGSRATADAAYGSLAWACSFERTPSGWRPTMCRETGAS